MGRFGLLGRRLAHSFSPLIHAELGDYTYALYEKEPDALADFLRNGDFDGLNVTIPYKKDVIPFCAGLSEVARATGSVNTLTRRGGGLYGDNTDFYGFTYLLGQAGVKPAGGKTLVLGGGGSSQTAQLALREMGAADVVVISRDGADNYQNIARHKDAAFIINTTPVGMYPDNGQSPLADLAMFARCRAVVDLIYNPARTELLLQAEARGIPAVNGLAMLAAQAKKSAELFTGAAIDDGAIDRAARAVARHGLNVVLIGMPGCGKSSVGAALAAVMGRAFADTDALVAEAAGKPIPDIFAREGERAFRARETETLRVLCVKSGLVIATGGGVVTQAENRDVMRQNGVVVFLDREIGELETDGRPLSQRDGAAALAKERLPRYRAWSDLTVPVRGVANTAAEVYARISGEERVS